MITHALSVRQPWAWLMFIDNPNRKDVENRTWHTTKRGRIWIHASSKLDMAEYDAAARIIVQNKLPIQMRPRDMLELGGIIGSIEITDCVDAWRSPWFFGPKGFVLKNPRRQPFTKCRGALGFFKPTITLTEQPELFS